MVPCSRRTFLKLAGVSLTGIACASLPPEDQPPVYALARSTAYGIAVRTAPNPDAPVLRKLSRDQIVTVVEKFKAVMVRRGILAGSVYWMVLPTVVTSRKSVTISIPSNTQSLPAGNWRR